MDQAEKQVRRMCGIIDSMTPQERAKPELIKANRKRRIAAGAGVQVQEVNRMLNQYDQMNTDDEEAQGRRADEDDARDEGHDARHALIRRSKPSSLAGTQFASVTTMLELGSLPSQGRRR
jgi:signal recognition particle GTPase